MGRKFHILDVFTGEAYSGNQLAVVEDADDLTSEEMMKITKEFGYSETVFLQKSEIPTAAAKLRIFTLAGEIPFAGHPTVGVAVFLGEAKARENDCAQDVLLVLDEQLGPVRCAISIGTGKASYAEFDAPSLPEVLEGVPEADLVADALSVSLMDIGFENHKMMMVQTGPKMLFVPMKNIQVVREVSPDFSYWDQAFGKFEPMGIYVYCRDGVLATSGFHARMFAPSLGFDEDAATGSAAASFAAVVQKFEIDGQPSFETTIEQGYEMGRPSQIKLEIEFSNRAIKKVRVGGKAVLVASGELM